MIRLSSVCVIILSHFYVDMPSLPALSASPTPSRRLTTIYLRVELIGTSPGC